MDRVLKLSDRLRDEGIDCQIDQYYRQTQIPEGWYQWMMNRIEESDFVLVVCTENYYLRFRGKGNDDVGRGVKWEGAIITQDIYLAGTKNYKYIPVLFNESGKLEYIPEPFRSSNSYWLDKEYENLYRHLSGQPDTPIPELGKLRTLPPRERKEDFLKDTQNSDREVKPQASDPEYSVDNFLKILESYRFDEEDLRGICSALFRKEPIYEEIINERGKRAIARKLIEYLESRDRIDDLVNYLREHRPDIKEELYIAVQE
jgi:hypothetical protein